MSDVKFKIMKHFYQQEESYSTTKKLPMSIFGHFPPSAGKFVKLVTRTNIYFYTKSNQIFSWEFMLSFKFLIIVWYFLSTHTKWSNDTLLFVTTYHQRLLYFFGILANEPIVSNNRKNLTYKNWYSVVCFTRIFGL
jgi:hypothetical protein